MNNLKISKIFFLIDKWFLFDLIFYKGDEEEKTEEKNDLLKDPLKKRPLRKGSKDINLEGLTTEEIVWLI